MRITKAMAEKVAKTHLCGPFMGSPTSASVGVSARVHWDILRRAASTVRQRLVHLAWRFAWRWPWAYALLLEIYRILPRIRFVLTTLQADRDQELSAGPACHSERDGCHPKCNRTRARIRGIREQETITPWMGRFEVYLFFRGWTAAERFLAGSGCSGSTEENTASRHSVTGNTQEALSQPDCEVSSPPP